METIKRGAVTVKVYPTSEKTWHIYCRFGGRRYLKHRARKEDALKEARSLADEIYLGLPPIHGIARKKLEGILEAEKSLEPLGVDLIEVARQYLEKHKKLVKRITVYEAAEQCLQSKVEHGCSERYLKTLKYYFSKFIQDFGTAELIMVETSDIDQWLRRQNLSPRSRNNLRDTIVTLFRWAQVQGFLPEGKTAAEYLGEAKEKGGAIELLTPEQLEKLLLLAIERNIPKVILYLVLGGFAGLRSAEMERLDWKDILEEHIEVAADKAKTATRRLVPVADNLNRVLSKLKR